MSNIGHNNPPDPIDEAIAPYSGAIEEAENWLDGSKVDSEGKMHAVDVIIKDLRAAKTELGKAEKEATKPLHDAWKREIARWKPTKDDLDTRLKGMVALVDDFKRDLAAKKEEELRKAFEAARKAEAEAKAAAEKASLSDYDAQIEAQKKIEAAKEANQKAAAAKKDTVKGMRTVTLYEVTDARALINWIARNDKKSVALFIEDWARKNHKSNAGADGLRVWQEKQAY